MSDSSVMNHAGAAGNHAPEHDVQEKQAPQGRGTLPLDEILRYENDRVVTRFLKLFDISRDEADELFQETKKFLWACSQTSEPLEPPVIIDEMWHNFILFTRDYAAFCRSYFGYFIHHGPADKDSQRREDPIGFQLRNASKFETQCNVLYDLPGEETLVKWFLEYSVCYDAKFFRKKTRPPNPRRLDFDNLKI